MRKRNELKVLAFSEDVQIICVTESNLNSSVVDAEVAIPNFNIFREDRKTNTRHGGSIMYVHSSLKVERLDWFKNQESLAVCIKTDLFDVIVVCIYRSPNLSIAENENLINSIKSIPHYNDDTEVVLVGDVNLRNVDWKTGIVNAPKDTINKIFTLQKEYLDTFISKGFKWFLDEKNTRYRMVNGVLQESLLDQVFSYNDTLVADINYLAQLGRSDHVSLVIELKVNNDIDFLTIEKQNWFKVDENFVKQNSSEINWHFSSENLDVTGMWQELNSKLMQISEQVPTKVVKTTREGEVLKRLPWDCPNFVRERKLKDKTWHSFENEPTLVNYNIAMFQQRKYERSEIKAKVKYEQKLVKNLKRNCKPLFSYLKTKSKINKSVSSLRCPNGKLSDSPKETAEILADFFQSVFSDEPLGPLPETCFFIKSIPSHANNLIQ